jgi:serine O-acetyltransferase
MIQSKEDYLFYVEADRIARGITTNNGKLPWEWFYRFARVETQETWDFQRLLRKLEYNINCKSSGLGNLTRKLLGYRFKRLSANVGFSIPPNVFGPGLCLVHRGPIVVHELAQVGENCRVRHCVTIGIGTGDPPLAKAPRIGNNVFIGPGAVIIGDVAIADNVAIGANSVVNRSFLEEGITIAGVPARKVSNKGSKGLVTRATELIRERSRRINDPAITICR